MKLNRIFILGACSIAFLASCGCSNNNDQKVLDEVNAILKDNANSINTCHDAIMLAEANQIELNDHKFSKESYEFAYDSKAKQFVIMDGDNIVNTSAGYTKSENTLDYFKSVYVYNPNSKYSQYLDKRAEVPEQLLITTGFDIGDHIDIPNIAYTNLSNNAHDVIVRTYSDYFSVLAPLDTIHHYEIATNIIVTDIATLDEHASSAYIKATKGYINFAKDSSTDFFERAEGAEEDVSIDVEEGAIFASAINIDTTKSGREISTFAYTLDVTKVSSASELDDVLGGTSTLAFIRLTQDIAYSEINLSSGKYICLDLAGYKISFNNETTELKAAISVGGGNSLFILDSQGVLDDNSGIDLLNCYISVHGGVGDVNAATLMINGGKITQTVTDDTYVSAAVICEGSVSDPNPYISNFSMYGGKIEAIMEGTATSATCVSSYGKGATANIVYGNLISDAGCFACALDGYGDIGGSTLTINGGHFVAGRKVNATCIEYRNGSVNLEINGGDFTGDTCLTIQDGNVHINNSIFNAKGQYREYLIGADGSTIYIYKKDNPATQDLKIEIVDSTLYSNFAYVLSAQDDAKASVIFHEGIYSHYLEGGINVEDGVTTTIDNEDNFIQHSL